ncbi:SIMPL domain-containing protein [Psychrobacillus antarcticus]|uniref:SIMPL domain-containing protein n=1 Tax=Psychrobacillus antarcticus TaxID=2879115 RepID=UPI00240786FB|nr:SIMPL domain-containing protein [Psychrobacillus antarcticus]
MLYSGIPTLSIPMVRVITVTGSGVVEVSPNYVQLQVEVSTEGKDVQQTQAENAETMNRVIESLLALNIPREHIQTAAYNVFPQYDYIEGKQVFRGYLVTNAVKLKITDVEKAGIAIDTAVANGANGVSSIQFGLENPELVYQQALMKALQNAQTKAQTIAQTMKLALHTQPISIVEEQQQNGPELYRKFSMASSQAGTPIEQGEITITAIVTVKYQY